jgi:hypothetical protein
MCKRTQRRVESGEDHEQANDDHDEAMRAHAGFPDEIAPRRSTNRHLVAMRSDPTVVVAGVTQPSLQR